MSQTIIYVDADACPVKAEVFRVAKRYALRTVLVANTRMRIPDEPGIELVVVGGAIDAADDLIAARVTSGDIVVSADILLASRCLERGAAVLTPTGKEYTPDSIGDAVASREIHAHLREIGAVSGGPPPLDKRDRSRFLQQLDAVIQRIRRGG